MEKVGSLIDAYNLLPPAVQLALPGWRLCVCIDEGVLCTFPENDPSLRVLLVRETELPIFDAELVSERIDWIKRKYANGGPLEIQSSMAA